MAQQSALYIAVVFKGTADVETNLLELNSGVVVFLWHVLKKG